MPRVFAKDSPKLIPALFFLSGFSSLVLETVFTRLLTYTFGNTAQAVSTVLASFLAGLAVGAVVIGRWVERRPVSLRLYGSLELLIACFGFFVPVLFGLLTQTYVQLYHKWELGALGLTTTRMLLSAALIIVPSFLMGGTLPLISRYVAVRSMNLQAELDTIYALNTSGGATGALVSTYVLMPSLGITGTVFFACGINLVIFFVTAFVSAKTTALGLNGHLPQSDSSETREAPASMRLLLIAAFLTGAVSLAYEVVWTHALSFLVGNTVYAFGVMLFTILAGLGWGARLAGRRLSQFPQWVPALAASQLLLALVVVLTLPLWMQVPRLFENGISGAYNRVLWMIAAILFLRITYVFLRNRRNSRIRTLRWNEAYEAHIEGLVFALVVIGIMPGLLKYDQVFFVAGELLRFLCIVGLLIVPAILLGLSFPLLLNLYTRNTRSVGQSVGRIYAANTIGTVLGSLVSGFVLIPWLGSASTLRVCATANIFLGLSFALGWKNSSQLRKWAWSTAAVATVLIAVGTRWNVAKVSGTYAYFTKSWPAERVLFVKEDVHGGLTSVVQNGNVRTLLSNGKFQGDNGLEIGTQIRFALVPALFTRSFDQALVIGLGTGHTLRTVSLFPFRKIHVAELAPQLVEAAREWFADVNDRVFDTDPRVSLSIADGRNFLLLSKERYDMITLESSSLWISGQADLYNKEFYELCRSHLTEQGVLQQWVAMHHLRTRDFLVVLNTAAQVFPHLAFFQGPDSHGFLIASLSPLEVDYATITRLDENPAVRADLKQLGIPSAWSMLGEVRLYEKSFRQALASFTSFTQLPANFASTDFYPYLEYQAPKGLTVPYDTVEANVRFLEKYRKPGLPADLNIRGVPSEDEAHRIRDYVLERQDALTPAAK